MKILHAGRAPFHSIAEFGMREELYVGGAAQLSMADGTPPAGNIATSIACYWNDDSLFTLFQANFRALRIAPTPPEMENSRKTLYLWEQSDVLELFIGQDARRLLTYGEFQVAPDGRWLDSRVRLDEGAILLDTKWESGLQVSSVVDRSRHLWRAAMQIPWKAFGTGDPLQRLWDMNCYRASGRFHGEELLAWSPTGYGEGCFHRPDRFGTLLLD